MKSSTYSLTYPTYPHHSCNLIPSTSCKPISFRPLQPSYNVWNPILPGISIDKVQLNGFGHSLTLDYSIMSLTNFHIAEIFKCAFPHLSFIELCLLSTDKLITEKLQIPFFEIANMYSINWTDFHTQIASLLIGIPENFLTWCHEKKVGPQDLSPLLSLYQTSNFIALEKLFHKIAGSNLSKTNGILALEIGIELILLDISSNHLQLDIPIGNVQSSEKWLDLLKSIRYPQQILKDKTSETAILNQNWPKNFQIRWLRQGDRSGIEIKTWIKSHMELERLLAHFQSINDNLLNLKEDLWKE